MAVLLEMFLHSGQEWHIHEAARLAREAWPDLKYAPLPSYQALRSLVDNEVEAETWTEENSEQVIAEFYQRWPDAHDDFALLAPPDITEMKRQLVSNNIIVEYRLLRPFILESKGRMVERELEAAPGVEPDMANVCVRSLETVKRILGKAESTVPVPAEYDNRVLLAIKSFLQRVDEQDSKFDRDVRDSLGDQMFENMTLPGLFSMYADAVDIDTARLVLSHIARYMVAGIRHRDRGAGERVRDLIEWIDQMKLPPLQSRYETPRS
jgi:hypothetical protein